MCKDEKTGKNNSKLSLYPLKFGGVVKNLLKVKPLDKNKMNNFTKPRNHGSI